MEPTTAQLLRRASYLLEEFGWIQFESGSYVSGFCLAGALNQAARDNCFCNSSIPLFAHVTEELIRGNPYLNHGAKHPIPKWNDQPYRTKEDVINLLQQIADKLDQSEDTETQSLVPELVAA